MDAAKAPGCQSVARAFRRLESRKGTLVVVVTAGILGHQPLCSAAWDADDRALEGAWDVNGRRVSERGAGDGPR